MNEKSLLIVNDIAGVGKVAANNIYSIVEAAGFEATILPTYLLSSNTEAPKIITQSTMDIYKEYLDTWNELDYQYKNYMTGFFAEIDQIDIFIDYYLEKKKQFPNIRLFVDPTMGDNGELYSVFNKEVPSHLGKLIQHADLVKPNITEACLLTGHPYSENMPLDEMKELALKVQKLGAKNTVLTGIRNLDDQGKELIGFLYITEDGKTDIVYHKYLQPDYFGTGDIVFSLMISLFEHGYSLHDSLKITGELTEKALRHTISLNREHKLGVNYQHIIPDLVKELYF